MCCQIRTTTTTHTSMRTSRSRPSSPSSSSFSSTYVQVSSVSLCDPRHTALLVFIHPPPSLTHTNTPSSLETSLHRYRNSSRRCPWRNADGGRRPMRRGRQAGEEGMNKWCRVSLTAMPPKIRPAPGSRFATAGGGGAARPAAAAASAPAQKEKEKKVTNSQEASSTLLLGLSTSTSRSLSSSDIRSAIEKGDVEARAHALECLIQQHVNGESQNHMIMAVIKHLTPLSDHYIKKLVLYFWEVIDKTDEDGNLLSEIILICNFLRNDLLHPNEYVRGLTLRFLCKVQEKEVIEPLVSVVQENLSHADTYVRRSALLAVHHIHRKFPEILPDAVDLMEDAIRRETDVLARRNAFDMLAKAAPDRAALFLAEFCEENIMSESGSAFLMSVVDFAGRRIRESPLEKARYVPVLFAVLQSSDPAVRYQCAYTLLNLSASPTAITQAALTYIDILRTHTDNTVRFIVLGQLERMKTQYGEVLQESLPDVLSVLHQNGPTEMRQCVWKLATDLITVKTVEGFVGMVRKELLQLQQKLSAAATSITTGAAGGPETAAPLQSSGPSSSTAALTALESYRMDLLRALSVAADRFPELVADTIAVSLPDYYFSSPHHAHQLRLMAAGDESAGAGGGGAAQQPGRLAPSVTDASNLELLVLLKRILLQRPSVRRAALNRLRHAFSSFNEPDLLRAALWLFATFGEGQAADGADGPQALLELLQAELQPLPLTMPLEGGASGSGAPDGARDGAGDGADGDGGANKVGLRAITKVREDGTYATVFVTEAEAAAEAAAAVEAAGGGAPPPAAPSGASAMRVLVTHGDGFLICAIASTVVRLVHLQQTAGGAEAAEALGMELLRELLRYAGSVEGTQFAVDDDAQEQIRLALAMLSAPPASASKKVWGEAHETSRQLIAAGHTAGIHTPAAGGARQKAEATGAEEAEAEAKRKELALSLDAPLFFSQLAGGATVGAVGAYDVEIATDVFSGGVGAGLGPGGASADAASLSPRKFLRRLEKVVPLSGSSDPIYCEACVTVNEFDVAVDWRLINCTPHLLQNIMVDLVSLGSMKLCERPQVYSLLPHATLTMQTSLKVASTETGVIFGSLLFDYPDGTHVCIVLNNIDIDVMNYIHPVKELTEVEFRRKWRALDWENKIIVSTPLKNLCGYLHLVERELNMGRITSAEADLGKEELEALLGPDAAAAVLGRTTTGTTAAAKHKNENYNGTNVAEEEETNEDDEEEEEEEEGEEGSGSAAVDRSGCLSCNLAARTAFGEDVLANVSIESDASGTISGIVRIRSGTHTLAYGVGKKLSAVNGDLVTTAANQRGLGGATTTNTPTNGNIRACAFCILVWPVGSRKNNNNNKNRMRNLY
eukprot:gene11750-8080_t